MKTRVQAGRRPAPCCQSALEVRKDMDTVPHAPGLSKVITIANTLVSLILIVGMVLDKHSVTTSTIAGVGYFALSTTTTLLILSGSLSAIVISRQHQLTTRRLHALQYREQPAIEILPAPHSPAQLATQPSEMNWVPAVANPHDTQRRDAIAWLLLLYQEDGRPDPSKVNLKAGEKQGSIWAKWPPPEAIDYLTSKGAIIHNGNSLTLNLTRFPTRQALTERLRRS
jgi:hypothetical protein